MATPSKKDAPQAARKTAAPKPAPQAAAARQPPAQKSVMTDAKAPLKEQSPGAPGASRLSQRDPSRDEIARRAYELWRERGGGPGQDQEDWHRAEQELRNGRH